MLRIINQQIKRLVIFIIKWTSFLKFTNIIVTIITTLFIYLDENIIQLHFKKNNGEKLS